MTTNVQADDINIYLYYANDVEKADSVMALYCRMYYIDQYLKKKKEGGTSQLHDNESNYLSGILDNIQKTHKALNMTKEEKQERVFQYCSKMYTKIVKLLKESSSDRVRCLDMLCTMINFIKILTIFGPLNAEWSKKCSL